MHHTVKDTPLLQIDKLDVAFPGANGPVKVVSAVDLRIERGEVFAVVGESGSGKTMLARAILDLLPPGGRVIGGTILLDGQDLRKLALRDLRGIRGARIGMVFQEPMMSLNPALRIGEQMAEAMRLHTGVSEAEIRVRSLEMLRRVRIREPEVALDAYPHEFSGGMRQRIMLASVFMVRPHLLIADEPTTALDVLIQKEVLDIMIEVARELSTAVLLITHDLGVVAEYADRILVMRDGVVCEEGRSEILFSPRHPYTRALLKSLPGRQVGSSSPKASTVPGSRGMRPFLEVRGLQVEFRKKRLLRRRDSVITRAVDGVSFHVMLGETVAIVGESGSGKTTLARTILGLVSPSTGSILVNGLSQEARSVAQKRRLRRKFQIVFQDPFSSLDPRMRISQIIGEGLRHDRSIRNDARRRRIMEALREVGLHEDFAARFPHELSGGQRQRACIARALIMQPDLIVADEPVSALDVTVQRQILDLFARLQAERSFACLFISHDLNVVEQIADRIIVMYRGRIVEMGSRDGVFGRPIHPYTCRLLSSAPALVPVNDGYRIERRRFTSPPPPPGLDYDTWDGDGARPVTELREFAPGHFTALRSMPHDGREIRAAL